MTDQNTVEHGVAASELVAAYAWNDAVVRLTANGVPVEYMNPKKGILFAEADNDVCGKYIALFEVVKAGG